MHYQSKVFSHPKKFLFLILKVLILMKQVKHHHVFYLFITQNTVCLSNFDLSITRYFF